MMRKVHQPLGFVFLAVLGWSTSAQVIETEIERTEIVLTEETRADAWRLSIDEWDAYQSFMQGPRGIWSPNLDPVTVLGIHAETDAERQRYAELLVMIEFERVEQELRFQQAYDEAARRLFPSLIPVQSAVPTIGSSLLDADRVAFIGSIDSARCPTCLSELSQLLREQRDPAAPVLDLFFEDAGDDATLRAFAIEQGIDPQTVIAGRITLNHAREPMSLPSGAQVVVPKRLERIGGTWLPLEERR